MGKVKLSFKKMKLRSKKKSNYQLLIILYYIKLFSECTKYGANCHSLIHYLNALRLCLLAIVSLVQINSQTVKQNPLFTFYHDSCILKTQNNYHMKNTSDALSQGFLHYCERVKQIDFSYKKKNKTCSTFKVSNRSKILILLNIIR